MRDMTRSYVSHDSFICHETLMRLFQMCDMTRVCRGVGTDLPTKLNLLQSSPKLASYRIMFTQLTEHGSP